MRKITFYLLVLFPLLMTNCSKDKELDKNITLNKSEEILYSGDEVKIEAISNYPITYSSENEYNALVSTSGLVTAMFIGETNVILSNGYDTKKFLIKVIPKSNLYPEPNFQFGISKNDLKAKLGTPDSETETSIAYVNYSYAATLIMYLFDSNGKMNGVGVMVKTEYSSSLGTFLAERYMPVDIDKLIFMNALDVNNATMAIGASLYNLNYWEVLYAPHTSTKSNLIIKSQLKLELSKTHINNFNF